MKIDTRVRSVNSSLAIEEVAYHIDPENAGHVAAMLRNMYSDPGLAVVREYVSNAFDVHKQFNITDTPVRVTYPTWADTTLRVRDFGPGLSKADTARLICGFGASGEFKRGSNEQIGGFGIGCKSAFSLTSNFTYTIFHEGVCRVWACFLDELDRGKAELKIERLMASDEPSGVLVEIPIPMSHLSSVQDALRSAFMYASGKLEISGAEVGNFQKAPPPAWCHGTLIVKVNEVEYLVTVEFVPQRLAPLWVQGGYPYDVDLGQISDALGVDANTAGILYSHLRITAPIGLVQLAPNREKLQYSGRTKQVLAATLKGVCSEHFLDQIQKRLTDPSATILAKATSLGRLGGIAATLKTLTLRQNRGPGEPSPFKGLIRLLERDTGVINSCYTLTGALVIPSIAFTPAMNRRWSVYQTTVDVFKHRKSVVTTAVSRGIGLSLISEHVKSDNACLADSGVDGRICQDPQSMKPLCVVVASDEQQIRGTGSVPRRLAELVIYGTAPDAIRSRLLAQAGQIEYDEVQKFRAGLTYDRIGVVLLATDADVEPFISKVPWMLDGSVTVVRAAEFMAYPEPDPIFFGRQTESPDAKAARTTLSSRGGAYVKSEYAQHGKRYVSLDEVSAGSKDVHSQNWEPIVAETLRSPGDIFLVPHHAFRLTVPGHTAVGAKHAELTSASCWLSVSPFRRFLATLRREGFLAKGSVILGVKHGDLDGCCERLQGRAVSFWSWLEALIGKWYQTGALTEQTMSNVIGTYRLYNTNQGQVLDDSGLNIFCRQMRPTTPEVLPRGPLRELMEAWRSPARVPVKPIEAVIRALLDLGDEGRTSLDTRNPQRKAPRQQMKSATAQAAPAGWIATPPRASWASDSYPVLAGDIRTRGFGGGGDQWSAPIPPPQFEKDWWELSMRAPGVWALLHALYPRSLGVRGGTWGGLRDHTTAKAISGCLKQWEHSFPVDGHSSSPKSGSTKAFTQFLALVGADQGIQQCLAVRS